MYDQHAWYELNRKFVDTLSRGLDVPITALHMDNIELDHGYNIEGENNS